MSGHGEVLQQAAFDAIEDNGEPITLVRVVTGTPDPVTGEAAQTRAEQTLQAIVSTVTGNTLRSFATQFEDGTLIITNLRTVVLAGLGLTFEPAPGDQVIFDDTTWVCIGATPERAEALNITFTLTVKR